MFDLRYLANRLRARSFLEEQPKHREQPQRFVRAYATALACGLINIPSISAIGRGLLIR